MTPDRLAEIEARLAAATPGDWSGRPIPPVETHDGVGTADFNSPKWNWSYVLRSVIRLADGRRMTVFIGQLFAQPGDGTCEQPEADLAFIAHAPTDIAALIAEVERLRQELGMVRYALAYFKNPGYWERREIDNYEVTVWTGSDNTSPWRLFDESAPRGESKVALDGAEQHDD